MKTIIKVTIILFLIIITYNCVPCLRQSLFIWNNSQHQISYHYSTIGVSNEKVYYPDTLLPKKRPEIRNIRVGKVDSFYPIYSWEKEFRLLPKDTLSIYIFSRDTLDYYRWSEIRENHKYLIRYDLSLDDLNMLDYDIRYPPSAKMRNMKMYPPYKK